MWSDGWDGYPAARLRLLGFLREIGARSCVVVTGDNHVNYVADLKTDFADLEAEPVATELCGTSISSPGPLEGHVPNVLRENPHIKHGDGTQRGYVVVDVTPERAVARLRVIDDPADRLTGVAAQATFAIEAGRPGAQAVTGAAARTRAAGGRT